MLCQLTEHVFKITFTGRPINSMLGWQKIINNNSNDNYYYPYYYCYSYVFSNDIKRKR